jgi:hypothetical protein
MVEVASARINSAACSLMFSLALLGCDGGGSSDSASVARGLDQITVSGNLQYEFVPPFSDCRGLNYAETELRPIRSATVQLIDVDNQAVIDSGISSESGAYSFTVAGQRQVFIRVRAELKRVGSPAWDVEVRDNTSSTGSPLANRPLYTLDSTSFNTGSSDQVLNLTASTGWDGVAYSGPRAAAPFAILDVIYAAISLVLDADPHAGFAPLDVFWSVNNSTVQGQITSGDIGTSFYRSGDNSLFLLGKADDDTEEFDSLVIAHEWGHYFEDNFSRSDSVGGPHGPFDRLDMRLAFGEGWATALAGMVMADFRYCDTFGTGQGAGFEIDLEQDMSSPRGWFNELSAMSIMYDLWDSPVGDDDLGSLGFRPLFEVFVDDQANTPAFTSLFSFMAALKARYPEQAAFVDSLLAQHTITGTDAYGSGEINDAEDVGDALDVLPVYSEITPDGTPVELCSNSQYDSARDGNKLSVYRYLRMRINDPAPYRITATTQSPPSLPAPGFDCSDTSDPDVSSYSDPDFLLVRNGQILLAGLSCTANSESATSAVLPTGDYVISLLEFRYADANTPVNFPDRSCFEISVSPTS